MTARQPSSIWTFLRRSALRIRYLPVAVVALTLVVCGLSPVATEAAAPPAMPACGRVSPATTDLPSAIPLVDQAIAPPPITSRAAVVVDGETGRVLYDLHAHDRLPPASTTKIMTALLSVESLNLDNRVVSDIDATKLIDSSVMGLRPGVPITVRDLLYGLLLPSGNDAAIELAKKVAGSENAFVNRMNDRAAALGLTDTHFVNPHGLDSRRHYSSAYDLAMMGREAMTNATFAALVRTQDHYLAAPFDYNLHNGNSMLANYPGADGVKIGWTDRAGWTLVASATREGHRVFVTVLDSKDRDADATALLDWAWQSHRWLPLGAGANETFRLAQRVGIGENLMRALAVCA